MNELLLEAKQNVAQADRRFSECLVEDSPLVLATLAQAQAMIVIAEQLQRILGVMQAETGYCGPIAADEATISETDSQENQSQNQNIAFDDGLSF